MAKKSYRQTKKSSTGLSHRIYEDVLSIGGTLLRSQKDFGAEKIQALAEATRNFGKSMTDLPNLRDHVTTASDGIEDLSNYVMNTDVDQMVQDAVVFARRHPASVLTTAVGAGLILTFLMRPKQAPMGARGVSKSRAKKAGKTRIPPVKSKRAMNGSSHANA